MASVMGSSLGGTRPRAASDANDSYRYDRDMHRVACLGYDGMAPFELGVVCEVFALPRPELGAAGATSSRCAPSAPARCGRSAASTSSRRTGSRRSRAPTR